MSEEKTVHCVTCCQALPPGMEHPKFFGQNLVTPDLTSVHELHVELEFMLDDTYTLLEVLMEREMGRPVEQRNNFHYRLYQILQSYTGEAKQRAIRLRNAGMYWQGNVDERPDESLFPDLPPPPANQAAMRSEPSRLDREALPPSEPVDQQTANVDTSPAEKAEEKTSQSHAPSASADGQGMRGANLCQTRPHDTSADTSEPAFFRLWGEHNEGLFRLQALVNGAFTVCRLWEDRDEESLAIFDLLTMASDLCRDMKTLSNDLYRVTQPEWLKELLQQDEERRRQHKTSSA